MIQAITNQQVGLKWVNRRWKTLHADHDILFLVLLLSWLLGMFEDDMSFVNDSYHI